jgi:putative transposase
MPRIARIAAGGMIQHVLNRGNGRMRLFHKPEDYQAFVKLLGQANDRVPGMRLLGYCLMPNHWHLALWPREDGELARYMSWLSNTHVRRRRQHWHSVGQGHVYQGRYKSFLVQEDDYFLTLMRYIEANPVRAGMVKRAEDWRWSSLGVRVAKDAPRLADWPVTRPRQWSWRVNQSLQEVELNAIRTSIKRGRPLGEDDWVHRTAERLGLLFTLRERGRPRKAEK